MFLIRFSGPTRFYLLLFNSTLVNCLNIILMEINLEKQEMSDLFKPKVQDLLKPQIHDNCRLAMPEGLQDLMSDISREVLRAQPKNLLQFITDYLAAMLVTRENLTTAAAVCDDVCDNMCAAGLEDELRYRGIDADDIKVIKKIVSKYLIQAGSGKSVKEGYLISKIIRKTSVSADKILVIKEAVRSAFLRQQAYNTTIYELTPDDSMDSITRATQHTLDLYRKTKPSDEMYRRAVQKIEAAYKAYGVRRQKAIEASRAADWFYSPDVLDRAEVDSSNEIDQATAQCKHITFESGYFADTETHYADTNSVATSASEKTDEIYTHYVQPETRLVTVSSSSLPGSFMNLPKYKPYNAGDETISEVDENKDDEEDKEETDEKQREEHFNVDYTREASITVNEPTDLIFDAEPDDVATDSSIEEEVPELKKVVIDSAVEILSDDRLDKVGEDDEIDEQIHQLAVDIEGSRI